MAHIDKDDRTRAVYEAALGIMARGGYSALTLRALAESLGGSMTLVTHYFPTQVDLMRGVLNQQLAIFEDELAGLEKSEDPWVRFRILLEWFLPLTDEDWALERARVLLALQAERDDLWMREHLDIIETRMRGLISQHLEPLIDAIDLGLAVDTVRLVVSGIVLSAVEHRAYWDRERQRTVIDMLWATLPWKDHDASIA